MTDVDKIAQRCWHLLRRERPDTWRAMVDDGSIRVHCRRRAAEAVIMTKGAQTALYGAVMVGKYGANHVMAIPGIIADIVDAHLLRP